MLALSSVIASKSRDKLPGSDFHVSSGLARARVDSDQRKLDNRPPGSLDNRVLSLSLLRERERERRGEAWLTDVKLFRSPCVCVCVCGEGGECCALRAVSPRSLQALYDDARRRARDLIIATKYVAMMFICARVLFFILCSFLRLEVL